MTARKWLPSASTRRPEMPPKAGSAEVSARPPRNSSAPKRVRAGSLTSKLSISVAVDGDAHRRRDVTLRLGEGERGGSSEQPGGDEPAASDAAAGRAITPRAGAARDGRAGSAGAFSSNSSASLSVMAPPSSSASTMVTARR